MTVSIRSQRGQSMVFTLIFLVVLIGMATLVLDVGSWYRTHRQAQATADAAALAGAQELPESTGAATTAALDYGTRNGGGVVGADVRFSTGYVANDTIEITARRPAQGVFAQLFGLDSMSARAVAKARAGVLGSARYAAPIGVDERHEYLQCEPLPCFGEPTTLELDKVGPGAFRIINIDGSQGGQHSSVLGEWIHHGLDAYMPLAWYWSDPGSSFNSSHVRDALDARMGEELLFPIYRRVRGGGSNLEYEIVGFVGWHLTDWSITGKGKLEGWFTRVIWEGIYSETETDDDFGARAISLVE